LEIAKMKEEITNMVKTQEEKELATLAKHETEKSSMIENYEEIIRKLVEREEKKDSFTKELTAEIDGLKSENRRLLIQQQEVLTLQKEFEKKCSELKDSVIRIEHLEHLLVRHKKEITSVKTTCESNMKEQLDKSVKNERQIMCQEFTQRENTHMRIVGKELLELEKMFNRSELKSALNRADAWKERNAILVGESKAAWKAYNYIADQIKSK
jgi:hypothetical protein